MHIRPLPSQADDLLLETRAPSRLIAHLRLVHDIACQLTAKINATWPKLVIDERAAYLGAAIHDIGKVIHPHELSEPGHEHEDAGRELLLKRGWSEASARFALTHGRDLGANNPIEDLLVAIADNVWKGKRNEPLEEALAAHIATASGQEPWEVWLTLDDILSDLAEPAAERLRWQASHSL